MTVFASGRKSPNSCVGGCVSSQLLRISLAREAWGLIGKPVLLARLQFPPLYGEFGLSGRSFPSSAYTLSPFLTLYAASQQDTQYCGKGSFCLSLVSFHTNPWKMSTCMWAHICKYLEKR